MTAIAEPGARATLVAPDRRVAHPQPAEPPEPGSLPGRSRAWRPVAGCLAAYFVLAVIAFLPFGPLDTRSLPIAGHGNPAGNDPFQMTWFLSYVPYALTHGLSIFHTNYVDYPTGVNLANNTSVPLLGILGWPITATLGPIATFNFLIRLSFALSGASMFLVLRRWCRSWQAAFLGGLLYAFGPYMASQELHLDLIFVPIPPLLMLFGDELVRRQKMSARLLGLLIGVAAAAQFVTSPDILSGCVLMALLVGAGLAIRFRDLIKSRIAYIVRAGIIATGSFVVLAAYPVYEMLLGPGHISGPVVDVSLLQSARADLFGAIVPTSNQLAAPRFLSWIGDYFVGGNLSENGTYLGIPLLILLYLILRRMRHDATVMVMAYTALDRVGDLTGRAPGDRLVELTDSPARGSSCAPAAVRQHDSRSVRAVRDVAGVVHRCGRLRAHMARFVSKVQFGSKHQFASRQQFAWRHWASSRARNRAGYRAGDRSGHKSGARKDSPAVRRAFAEQAGEVVRLGRHNRRVRASARTVRERRRSMAGRSAGDGGERRCARNSGAHGSVRDTDEFRSHGLGGGRRHEVPHDRGLREHRRPRSATRPETAAPAASLTCAGDVQHSEAGLVAPLRAADGRRSPASHLPPQILSRCGRVRGDGCQHFHRVLVLDRHPRSAPGRPPGFRHLACH